MADRHSRDPISYRPKTETAAWLDDIAKREGRPVRAVVGDAVERARRISEADLGAFDREVDRRTLAYFTAKRDSEATEELAALNAAIGAYQHAISQWQPPRRDQDETEEEGSRMSHIMAYIDDDGGVSTMPVSDRDEFQPGVTTAEAWEAMSLLERDALAERGSPESIRQRESARAAAASRRKAQGRQFARQVQKDQAAQNAWRDLPLVMFEAGEDGVTAWRRTSETGAWEPADDMNITRAERWDDDSNDYAYDIRPRKVTGQPRGKLLASLAEAEAISRELRAADDAPSG